MFWSFCFIYQSFISPPPYYIISKSRQPNIRNTPSSCFPYNNPVRQVGQLRENDWPKVSWLSYLRRDQNSQYPGFYASTSISTRNWFFLLRIFFIISFSMLFQCGLSVCLLMVDFNFNFECRNSTAVFGTQQMLLEEILCDISIIEAPYQEKSYAKLSHYANTRLQKRDNFFRDI